MLEKDIEGCLGKGAHVMAFPEGKREIYNVNPLEEVICQLRFPPILRIDSETPAAFQERVRVRYPFFKCISNMVALQGLPPNMIERLGRDFPSFPYQQNYEFGSADGHWALILTRESLTLTCKCYERWSTFKDRISEALEPLLQLYSPNFFVRLGLRYRNLIRRSRLGLRDTDWSELLNPWILGAYSSPDIKDDIETNSLQMQIRLPEYGGKVLVSCGAVNAGPPDEVCYLIDADFFIGPQNELHTEPGHALQRLEFLNIQSHRFFRWCIRDALHTALTVAR